MFSRPSKDLREPLLINRLEQVLECIHVECVKDVLLMPGDKDNERLGFYREAPDLLCQRDAVHIAAGRLHPDVQEEQVKNIRFRQAVRSGTVFQDPAPPSLLPDQGGEVFPDRFFIVTDRHPNHLRHPVRRSGPARRRRRCPQKSGPAGRLGSAARRTSRGCLP